MCVCFVGEGGNLPLLLYKESCGYGLYDYVNMHKGFVVLLCQHLGFFGTYI